MNDALKTLERFHGHLGPYAIIGYKMGEIANNDLGSDPFSKNVIVSIDTKPPISCIIDGIQISSGCTLGKGNIQIRKGRTVKALFTNKNGKKLQIKLKPDIQKEIEENVTEENMISFSEKFFERSSQDLFEIQ